MPVCSTMRSRESSGFTLIEILVVSGIVILLMGSALLALVGFGDRKGVQSDAQLVVNHLRSVRVKAMAVEVPDECSEGVLNYEIIFSGKSILTKVNCNGGGSVDLPQLSLKKSEFFGIESLKISAGSGMIDGVKQISLCGDGYGYKIDVAVNGIASQPVSDDSFCH